MMFGRQDRQDRQDEVMRRHMEHEEKAFARFNDTLDKIGADIQQLKIAVTTSSSNNELALNKNKEEILNKVFGRVVSKHEYEKDWMACKADIVELKVALAGKVNQSSVRLVYIVITLLFGSTVALYRLFA